MSPHPKKPQRGTDQINERLARIEKLLTGFVAPLPELPESVRRQRATDSRRLTTNARTKFRRDKKR